MHRAKFLDSYPSSGDIILHCKIKILYIELLKFLRKWLIVFHTEDGYHGKCGVSDELSGDMLAPSWPNVVFFSDKIMESMSVIRHMEPLAKKLFLFIVFVCICYAFCNLFVAVYKNFASNLIFIRDSCLFFWAKTIV